MSFSMHQASIPVFLRGLQNLSGILDKAEANAAERKIDPAVFLNDRLAPDMFPFTRQIQIASDHAKGAPARLAGVEVPKFEDTEKTFDDLRKRLARVTDFIRSVDAKRIDGSESREIVLTIGGRSMTFNGETYLLRFALPNFYFHSTAAYLILRHNGVPVGKGDFIGPAT